MTYITPPRNNQPLTLFEYSVKMVIALGLMNETNAHKAWANLIFRYEKDANMRSHLMSKVKHDYNYYFSPELHYKFLEDNIRANFPYLFGIEEELNIFERISKALEAECTAQKDPRNQKRYKVASCENISSKDGQYIYKALLQVEEGDDPHFTEGVSFMFVSSGTVYSCDVVEFDYANATLYFSSARSIFVASDARVISDATMNTIALKDLLEEISINNIREQIPLFKFLNGTTKSLTKIYHKQYPSYLDDYLKEDVSQQKAFKAALNNDITFIWGPPGTGKSYTLATIIMALYHMTGERTAVYCLSNVAVDQLLNNVVRIIGVKEPLMKRGEFYRAGRTQDAQLYTTDFLYPDDEKSSRIRKRIKLLNVQLDSYKKSGLQYSDEAIELKAKLKDERESLKDHTDYLINQVKVVFSTISNFVINKRLKDGDFDNLIVDEASMLALPQLIALARKVTKRIILVGDFQQLSPITVAGVPLLKDNVFKLCGIDIDHTDHPALCPLLNQRRSNPKLVEIINRPFYSGHLIAHNKKYTSIVARPPFSECVVGMYSVTNGKVRFTKGGTRQNIANSEAVMELLDIFYKEVEETFSIGVITPYTGQVSLLKALFGKKNYSPAFLKRVKIGTVHTFQGSESDVIIFDMVDCSKFEKGEKVYAGKIFAGDQGEQLLNVAISRARHKLIVVCDPDYMANCPGDSISFRSMEIFNALLRARWTKK
jgi:hypothetical protein